MIQVMMSCLGLYSCSSDLRNKTVKWSGVDGEEKLEETDKECFFLYLLELILLQVGIYLSVGSIVFEV